MSFVGRKTEFGELVDRRSRRVADADYGVCKRRGRQVDDALAAVSDHMEAVIAARDHAPDERWGEFQYGVPTQRHYVGLALPLRRHQHDRAWLEIAPHLAHREIALLRMPHHVRPSRFGSR